ncbi:NAC domain-containing protein [Hirschfeldia incana]|nr:NAC domain-containing protein [Hirschfeldia incana]
MMSNNYEDGGLYCDTDDIMFNNDEDGGVYFDPEDQELIKEYLLPKLKAYLQPESKEKDCEDFIAMKNVYDKEPWLLDHTNNPLFKKNEWFYFVTRTQVSVKNTGRGKNSKKRIIGDNDGGSWKPNAKKYIEDEETKEIIGKKQTLKFTQSNKNKKKQKRGDGTSIVVPGSNSSWIMHEYSLPDENMFQELVLCKIRKISNSKDEEVEAMEVAQDVEEDWTGALSFLERLERTGLDDQQITEKDDQQEPPIYGLSQSSDPPARLGDNSLPIEVDGKDEEEVWNQEFAKYLF